MKGNFINSTKKRLIREIRRILYEHPVYRADSQNVQNKFSFEGRPQRGVVINNATADRIRLSADNYMGRLSSFVMLAPVENQPGTSIEWVRENFPLLEQYSPSRDIFPSPPGVYIVEITQLPDTAHNIPGQFTVDPILEIDDEPLIIFSSSTFQEAQISRVHLYPGSVRLYLNGRRALKPNVDYNIDYETGVINFVKDCPSGDFVSAEYKFKTGLQGPFPFNLDQSEESSIPGAVLAFGKRAQLGDRLAIKVNDRRQESAEVYGGKFEVSFEIVAWSRDAEDRELLSDYIIIKILEAQNGLGYDGLELLDCSPGGENEDIYNEEIDDYYYSSTINISMRVDWETYYALPVDMWRVEQTSKQAEEKHGFLDGSFPLDQLKIGKQLDAFGVMRIGRLSYERL